MKVKVGHGLLSGFAARMKDVDAMGTELVSAMPRHELDRLHQV